MNTEIVSIIKFMRHRCMMICENCACFDEDKKKCLLTRIEELFGIRKKEEEKAKNCKLFEKPLYSFNYYNAKIEKSDIVCGMFPKLTLTIQKLSELQQTTKDFNSYKYQILKKEDTCEWCILLRKKTRKQ